MALVKCKECGTEISKKAKTCPKCGVSRRRDIGCLPSSIAIIIALVIIVNFFTTPDAPKPKPQLTVKEQQIKDQFNAWDGSHYKLTRIIKKSMNDPDSYDHVSTKYWEKDGKLKVITEFRGKNGFGGVVTQSIGGVFTMDGELIEIIE